MTRWLKLYSGASSDEKIVFIADEAGVPRPVVSTTWIRILEFVAEHHPEDGSIEGFSVVACAAWCQTAIETIERVLDLARKYLMLTGNFVTNWIKRQKTAKNEPYVNKPGPAQRSAPCSTARVQAHRRRRAETEKQMSLLLPISSSKSVDNQARNAADETGETPVSCVSETLIVVENINENNQVRGNALEKRRKDSYKRSEGSSGARCARLSRSAADWLRQRKREALIAKLFRFAHATHSAARFQEACAGLMSDDRAEAQRWVDLLDREMRRSGWNVAA